ncbi:hypothetical protein HYDPIDRAFT_25952 [Hydnomerulius pinastri MD-312]|nr:hypothetical protein HYDPIDRAFT_25952 [Hydnomerulius pinastri MD-312]
MPGGTLRARVESPEPLGIDVRLHLLKGVAAGLEYLHSQHVMHGDLHYMNVLVDGENNARLTDFGMTSVVGEVCAALEYLQTANVRHGSMMWAAPELFPNADHPSHVPEATVKSDIYSLGSIIRFVLSGEPPWPPEVSDLEKKIREGEIPERPASLAPPTWNEIWTFIERRWSPHSPPIRPSAKEVLSFISSFQLPPPPPVKVSGHRQPSPPASASLPTSLSAAPSAAPSASTPHLPPSSASGSSPAAPSTSLPTTPSTSEPAAPSASSLRADSSYASPKTFNIILFGETGVGRSSVINFIAGQTLAKVSSDPDGHTMASTPYDFTLESLSFRIYDTVALEEPQTGVNSNLTVIEKASTLIHSLGAAGGVHLLLFCLRAGEITATAQSNYRLFYELLCDKKVPIALVFTGLERERNMEDWWIRNESNIKKYGIHSIGHACITTVKDGPSGQEDKYTESKIKIRALLTEHAVKSKPFQMESEDWVTMFLRRFQGSIVKKRKPKPKDTVKILAKRCGMDAEAAKRVAELIK